MLYLYHLKKKYDKNTVFWGCNITIKQQQCVFLRSSTFQIPFRLLHMCLWIYQGGRFPPFLELPVIYRTEDSSLYFFYTTIFFGEIYELYYLKTLKKTRLKICCYQKRYRYSLRTVDDSLKQPTKLNIYLQSLHQIFLFFNIFLFVIFL